MIHPDAILIPQSSTIEIQDKMFVYTVDSNNKVSKIPITILGTEGTNYLVKEGLKAGDQIVFDGIDKLKEGEVIKPEKVKQDPTKTTSR